MKLAIAKVTLGGTAFVKVIVRGSVGTQPVDVVPPNPGTEGGLTLQVVGGDRFCVRFGGAAGGTIQRDTAERWKVINATSQPGCAVQPANQTPIADAGPRQAVGTGTPVVLDGSRSADPDQDLLVFQWALIHAPAGSNVVLNAASTPNPYFVPDLPGIYVAELVVGDGLLLSEPATVMITATVGGPGVTIAITEPGNGASLPGDTVLVRGTVQGPSNLGVSVNGVRAAVHGGTFVANRVPLAPGSNELLAVASVVGGQAATASVSVTAAGVTPALELSVSPDGGVAPLVVTATYRIGSTPGIRSGNIDFGDGTSEPLGPTTSPVRQHFYDTPGLYVVHVAVVDEAGTALSADATVAIDDVYEVDAVLTAMWSGMNAALVVGDRWGALSFLDGPAQTRYGPIFDGLLPHMPAIVGSYSPPRGVAIMSGLADYAVNRTIAGENRLFLISFMKDGDGVWRIDTM